MNKILLKGVNETLYHEVLPNGLNIYLLPNKQAKNFYISFSTHFGSIYTNFKLNDKEYKIPNGIAHFLEHITFKMEGGIDASAVFADLGSSCNAYTSHKVTCYETMGSSLFKENLDYLLTYVQSPYYTDEIVANEKGIICEEIKMYKDKPGSRLFDEINKCLFKEANYKYNIAGECEDVNGTTLEDINNTYKTFYHPSNMFVIITGLFDPEEALTIIKDNQSKKDFGKPNKIEILSKKEPNEIVKKESIIKYPVEIDKVSVSIKVPKDIFKKLNITDAELINYMHILMTSNFGKSSILKEQLVKDGIIQDGLSVRNDIVDDHIIITILAETKHKDKLIDILIKQFNNLSITKEDFNRKKKVIISEYIQSFDNIELISYLLQTDLIEYNKIIDNYYDLYNNLDINTMNEIIKLTDVKEMATVILTREN